MKKKLIYTALFSTVLLIASHQTIAQAEKAEAAIQQLMQTTPVVGLSVAVVKDNKIIYNHSFGYKDLEQKLPLQNDHIFRIASISKSFTTTAIMQLVAEKKIRLDQDISELVGFKVRNPAYPSTVITLKMALSHRSSINDSEGYFSLDAIDPATNPNFAKCYNAYEPDKGYMYCNLNYNLAGSILEKITGIRFDKYIQQQILDPLGLYGGYNVNALDTQLIAGKTMIGHTGSAYGLYSILFFEPKEKIGFVVISNGCDTKTINGFNAVLHQTVNSLYNNLIR